MWNKDPKLTRPVVRRRKKDEEKRTTSDLKTERIQNEKDPHQSIAEAPQEEETGNEGEGEDKFALPKLQREGQEDRVSRDSTLETERNSPYLRVVLGIQSGIDSRVGRLSLLGWGHLVGGVLVVAEGDGGEGRKAKISASVLRSTPLSSGLSPVAPKAPPLRPSC